MGGSRQAVVVALCSGLGAACSFDLANVEPLAPITPDAMAADAMDDGSAPTDPPRADAGWDGTSDGRLPDARGDAPKDAPSDAPADTPADTNSDAPPTTRTTSGLVALYTFSEGSGATVGDTSGVAPALDLTIGTPAAVSWIAGRGLSVNAGVIIASSGPATKIIQQCMASNEVTLEAWTKPALASQGSPSARIVAVSGNPGTTDTQLAQIADMYDARLRTTTNPFGPLASPPASVTTTLTHVVFTHASTGASTLYLNGQVSASTTQAGDFSTWEASFSMILANGPAGAQPWVGSLYLVAVYQRALSAQEVSKNFAAGF